MCVCVCVICIWVVCVRARVSQEVTELRVECIQHNWHSIYSYTVWEESAGSLTPSQSARHVCLLRWNTAALQRSPCNTRHVQTGGKNYRTANHVMHLRLFTRWYNIVSVSLKRGTQRINNTLPTEGCVFVTDVHTWNLSSLLPLQRTARQVWQRLISNCLSAFAFDEGFLLRKALRHWEQNWRWSVAMWRLPRPCFHPVSSRRL